MKLDVSEKFCSYSEMDPPNELQTTQAVYVFDAGPASNQEQGWLLQNATFSKAPDCEFRYVRA